ncbi:hypothetical protein ACFVWF_28650 [Rhodococcus qingshengii]|uniref:hypothetical protein n=1 Tax=Rhodococcus qingshengii TaxID=334542 RepID=UPI0036DCFA32
MAILATVNVQKSYQQLSVLTAENARRARERAEAAVLALPSPGVANENYRRVRSRFWAILAAWIAISMYGVAMIWMSSWPHEVPEGKSGFEVWRSSVSGWIDPATSFAFSVAVLGVVATINIAVSFVTAGRSVVDQIETNFWSSVLAVLSIGASMISFGVALFAWPSVDGTQRSTTGLGVLSTLLAIGCLGLAASIRLKADTAAARSLSLHQVNQKIEQLEERQRAVLGGTTSPSAERTFKSAATLVFHYVVVSVGLAAIGYLAALLALGSNSEIGMLACLLSTSMTTSFIWYGAHYRWTIYRSIQKWTLETSSKIFAALWIAVVALIGVGNSVNFWIITIFAALPLVAAMLVSLSRPARQLWAPARWLRWFSRPVWVEVDRSIQSQLTTLKNLEIELRTSPLRN